jgi:hypothetical protein
MPRAGGRWRCLAAWMSASMIAGPGNLGRGLLAVGWSVELTDRVGGEHCHEVTYMHIHS